MKTVAMGFFNGEKVRVVSVWFNASTEKAYCELYFGESGYDNGLRTQLDNVSLLQWVA